MKGDNAINTSNFELNEGGKFSYEQLSDEAIKISKECGLISEERGNIVFHKEKIDQNLRNNMYRKGMAFREAIKYLGDVVGEEGTAPLLTLPQNKKEVLSGEWSRGVYDYEDLVHGVFWDSSIVLKDNLEYTMAEIQIIRILKAFSAHYNKEGDLVGINSEGKEEKLTVRLISKESPFTLPMIDRVDFATRPVEFLEKYGQRLAEAGIIRSSDFERGGPDIKKETYVYKEKILDSHQVGITGPYGFVSYYLGRGKFVGTDIEREEGQVLMMLDKDTAGIFSSKHGGDKRLLAYFKLADDEEISDLYAKFRAKGVKESKLASHAQLGADFMKRRIKKYEPDSFCRQKNGESALDYAKRMTKMNDQTYQFEVFRPMMQEAGVRLEEISWEEQTGLFGSVLDQKDKAKILDFSKKYGADGIRTFLSLEFDQNLGEGIIKIGEKLPSEDAGKIFAKYAELISQLDKVGDVLKGSYGKTGQEEEIIKIKEAILKKGKDLLAHFAGLVEEGGDTSEKALMEQLEDIQAEAITFFLTFKTLKETGELPPIEEIRGLALEQIAGGEISESDLVAMRSIYEKNYANMPEIVEKVLSNFDKRALDPKTHFYILKHEDKVRGFAGFTNDKESIHAHSINIDPSLKSMSLGSVLIEKTIEQEAKGNVIRAECFTFLPIGARYIEDGFTGIGLDKYVEYPIIKIVRDDSKVFETKQKAKEDFVKEYLQFEINGGEGECDKGEYFIVKAPTQKEIDMSYLDRGHILTRYFSHTTNKGGEKKDWYAVFEKKQAVKEESVAA